MISNLGYRKCTMTSTRNWTEEALPWWSSGQDSALAVQGLGFNLQSGTKIPYALCCDQKIEKKPKNWTGENRNQRNDLLGDWVSGRLISHQAGTCGIICYLNTWVNNFLIKFPFIKTEATPTFLWFYRSNELCLSDMSQLTAFRLHSLRSCAWFPTILLI